MDRNDKRVLRLARVIHHAKIDSCYFPNPDGKLKPGFRGYGATREAAHIREPFPDIRTKEFRTMNHHGQCHIDIAIDQAIAVLKFQQGDEGK